MRNETDTKYPRAESLLVPKEEVHF